MKRNLNKYLIIMFILIIAAEILIRIKNNICNIIGIVLLPIIIIIGIKMLYKDKKQNQN